MRQHRLYGLTLASDYAFESRLSPGEGDPDLVFSSATTAPFAATLGEPTYVSPLVDESGDSLACLYDLPQGELLRFGDALDFYLRDDRIDCHLRDPDRGELVEIRLLGPVLAYWLERLSILTLHASAVVVEGRAVAFMATNRGGKSGLAAAMMSGGAQLLTDDLLPLESSEGGFSARSGYPQMRMHADGVAHFVGDRPGSELTRARLGKHWVPVRPDVLGLFHDGEVPLGCIYLPERLDVGGGGARISVVPPRQAVIELLRCSFSPYIVEAVGLQPQRLEAFADLVRNVPVRRLTYPSGFGALPEVCASVLADTAVV